MKTMTRSEWAKIHKDYKVRDTLGRLWLLHDDNGTCLVQVRLITKAEAAMLATDDQYNAAALGAEEDDAGDWHDQRARREAYDDTPIDPDNVPF